MGDIPFPNKRYNVIYADPPWLYRNKKTGENMISGAAEKYPIMTLDEICSLPISEISETDCVLFLWATTPLKIEAFEVLKKWEFTYKTTVYWRKIMSLGMGYWFRGQIEELLVAIKGKVKAFHLQESNFIQCKVLSHSEKPEEFRQLIERATSKISFNKRIELFARKRVDGWDGWGNEIDGTLYGANVRSL